MRFPKIQSTFGVTPYNPDRDTDEKRRAIFEHYQSQMGAQPLPPETLPWNRPFPPGVEAQQAFDTMLQERVVDPLARAGYEDLGAGLAAIPSAAHEIIVPQTEFDVAGTIIPLPGVAKAMKQGKYRKIRAAMKAEDPEKVGEIIAKQAGKIPEKSIYQERGFGPTGIEIEDWIAKISKLQGDEQKKSVKELLNSIDDEAELRYVKNNLAARRIPIDNAKAEVRAIDEKEMLRKADEANLKENQRWELEDRIRKKEYDKAEAKATEDAVKGESSDWTKIDPKKLYELDGMVMSGKELKDELLQMSTGDFHMAKWKEFEKPKKFESVDDLIKEFREFANIPQKPKIPLTSLQKGGWYDEIGGREGFEPQLENLKKLNPKAQQLHDAIDEYLKRESYRDPNIYRNDYIENAYDNIIDLIDKNLDRIKLPKPLSPGDQAIDRVLKAGQKEGKLSLPERSQLEKAMSESKKAIEAEENVEFHKERFKKIKELLGNVSMLKGKD